MPRYKGMNFAKWCALDTNDERKIIYEKTPIQEGLKFTSEDYGYGQYIGLLRSCKIEDIKLIDNEWHIWLV